MCTVLKLQYPLVITNFNHVFFCPFMLMYFKTLISIQIFTGYVEDLNKYTKLYTGYTELYYILYRKYVMTWVYCRSVSVLGILRFYMHLVGRTLHVFRL